MTPKVCVDDMVEEKKSRECVALHPFTLIFLYTVFEFFTCDYIQDVTKSKNDLEVDGCSCHTLFIDFFSSTMSSTKTLGVIDLHFGLILAAIIILTLVFLLRQRLQETCTPSSPKY